MKSTNSFTARSGLIIDLTAPLGPDTCTYPTDPPFVKTWHVNFPEVGACCSRIDFGPHAGTHVDVPLHFIEGGADIPHTSLEKFYGEAIAIQALKSPGALIEPEDLAGADIRAGDIVLIRTGWDVRINTPRLFEGEWPGFSAGAIECLANRGVKAIGTDSPSADSPAGLSAGALAHHAALSRGMPIFETLINLDQVVGKRFLFFGLPLKIVDGEASPIRAVAFL